VNILELSLAIGVGSFLAGLLGALTGLGGGVVVVPLLALGFGVDIRYAIGASLISVIATSSAAAAAYVRDGYSNLRIGMFLEVATTCGAVGGAALAGFVSTDAISVIFGLVLLYSAYASLKPPARSKEDHGSASRLAEWLRLESSYPGPDGSMIAYRVYQVPAGFLMMIVAGGLSGLLGIGSGAFKVLAMDKFMKLPFKVSTTTSNFMIGVTAAASAGIYLRRGYIDPSICMAVILGILPGALLGTRILMHTQASRLRIVFALVIVGVAAQMIYHGLVGGI
jgi:uncharacterized membrane protein YfcA